MTGSLQIKKDKFYMVLNLTQNGKRRQKWISTGYTVKGNKKKAEQMLRETLREYEIKEQFKCSDMFFPDAVRLWLKECAGILQFIQRAYPPILRGAWAEAVRD